MMNGAIRVSLLPFLLLATAARGAEPGGTISVDEIVRGMRGYGLTVFEGTRIDTFQVEVIDVMRGRGGTGDVILARFSGLGLETAGISQGMSGSPVYIEGRNAGAVAFAYPFASEPIGGITPIGEMLEVFERGEADEGSAAGGLPEGGGHSSSPQGPAPIGTPLLVSGFPGRLAEEVGEFFRPYGFVPTVGGSGGAAGEGEDWKALPGAAVGVRLLGGDASLTGVGTITWVDGDRILAFGHPMFQAGSVNFPLVSVEVHARIPSRYISFKLGSPIEAVGALVEDRRPGVAGRIGAVAPTIPIEVVVDAEGAERREYRYEAMDDKRLTPMLVSWAVQNSVLHGEKAIGDGTVRLRLFVDLEGADDLERENVYSSGAALDQLEEDVLLPLQVLANNPLARPRIRAVRAEVEARDGRSVARIERLELEKGRLRPGETVRGAITLRMYQGETRLERFEMALPPDLVEGELLLRACDAASSEEWDSKRSPNRFATKDINMLVRYLKELRTNEGIYLQLFRAAEGVTVDGREMPELPESRLRVVREPLHADDGDLVKGRVVASRTIRVDAFVTGCRSLAIEIDRDAP
ncbi:MAG: hypothetical protein EHM19_04375 [Candidatus Latescibacterota bacterium]|nr:MAG: hypothetical protein EHM19_04375 [Candidatus Latescibacterota bacterium]